MWPMMTLRKRKMKLGAMETRERLEFQKVWKLFGVFRQGLVLADLHGIKFWNSFIERK